MKTQAIVTSLLTILFVSACVAAPAATQEQDRVAIIAVDLTTGKFIDPKTGKTIDDYKKGAGGQFGINVSLFNKFLEQAKNDKSFIPPKELSEKAFRAKYPNIKSSAELYFTKSSPGCNTVCTWGGCTQICD